MLIIVWIRYTKEPSLCVTEHAEDDVIDEDIILLWGEEKKVITGSDILGSLLRGIVRNETFPSEKP